MRKVEKNWKLFVESSTEFHKPNSRFFALRLFNNLQYCLFLGILLGFPAFSALSYNQIVQFYIWNWILECGIQKMVKIQKVRLKQTILQVIEQSKSKKSTIRFVELD